MIFELREWREGDAASIAPLADNPKIAANLRNAFPYPYTLADAESYVSACVHADEAREYTRAICVDGSAVGSIGVFLLNDVYDKCAEIGYWLAEPFWGQNIMTSAVKYVTAEAFKRFDICRIQAEVFAFNEGSRRVLEKAGFTLEGVLKNRVYKNGRLSDACMYALLRK